MAGATEKDPRSGSLYCSMIYLSPKEGLLGVHRKIKPTGTERLVWREAGGESLVTFDTNIGRLGGLICWENYMPLARKAMYRKGVELYIAPTADSREEWTATMRHIALEGRCFVLGCKTSISPNRCIRKNIRRWWGRSRKRCARGAASSFLPWARSLPAPCKVEEKPSQGDSTQLVRYERNYYLPTAAAQLERVQQLTIRGGDTLQVIDYQFSDICFEERPFQLTDLLQASTARYREISEADMDEELHLKQITAGEKVKDQFYTDTDGREVALYDTGRPVWKPL